MKTKNVNRKAGGDGLDRVVRRVPISWPALFREAGIAPCPCKLAKPLVAGGEWCLMIDTPGETVDLRYIVVSPPPLERDETHVKIEGRDWAFFAPNVGDMLLP